MIESKFKISIYNSIISLKSVNICLIRILKENIPPIIDVSHLIITLNATANIDILL